MSFLQGKRPSFFWINTPPSHVDNRLFRRPNHTQTVSQFSHYHREVQQAEPCDVPRGTTGMV
jgi:hypothetical protein